MPVSEFDPKSFLCELFDTAVAEADPLKRIPAFLPQKPKGRLVVIGAGKASARMAEAVEKHYGPCEGKVITRYGYSRPTAQIEILEASHPVPDEQGVEATKTLLSYVSYLTEDDLVIALISGGGSALLCAPVEGVSLVEKQSLNQQLLARGAPISDMNIIRKYFSAVKGGKLADACGNATILGLVISDVPGDDLSLIASGPTVAHENDPALVKHLMDKWAIEVPLEMLNAAVKANTITRPGSFDNVSNHIIAAPSQSLNAAAALAKDCGIDVEILGDDLQGEARDLGAVHARLAIKRSKERSPEQAPLLILSGGECTVTRTGNGVGGPNAEYALSAAIALAGHPDIHLFAGDTDGVDGAAEVAGSIVTPSTTERAQALGISMVQSLVNNDAHSFFANLDDQMITGPTFTNVNDFRAILVGNVPSLNRQ